MAVAGLILEDDYFYNPNIPSSSSSPVSPYNDRKVSNKRLTSGGGSAGHSSPSPSSSSSTSLEIDQVQNYNLPLIIRICHAPAHEFVFITSEKSSGSGAAKSLRISPAV